MADWRLLSSLKGIMKIYIDQPGEKEIQKIRPRFVEKNFASRHKQFEIQNEWRIQDLNEFLNIMRKPTFGLLKNG